MLDFLDIRNQRYADLREDSLKNGGDFDNFKRWPYTCLKGRILAELASILVYIIQFIPIHPNHITFFYAFSGVIGALFLGSQNTQLILFGIVIFFMKNLPDWIDGFLARLKNLTSEVGKVLDPWGALVNSHAFIIGFSLYVFNSTGQMVYIYMLILIMFLRAIDLRNYMFIQFMNRIINNDIKLKSNTLIEPGSSKQVLDNLTSKGVSSKTHNVNLLSFVAKFALNFLDDRSRSVDFVCFIIVLEVIFDKILLSNLLMFGYFFKYLLLFFGGLFIVYFKNAPSKIKIFLTDLN